MIFEYADFERILGEMMPRTGRHDWAVNLSRWGQSKGRRTRRRIESLVKRAFNPAKPYFIFETGGLKMFGDRRDRYARGIAVMDGYEEASANHILAGLKTSPGAYLDVGTNMGVLGALIASKTSERVIAVEPDPETARRAACTFALNGLRNVTLFNGAIGAEDGEMSFFTAPGSSDAASLSGATVGGDTIEVKVPVLSIDSLVRHCGVDRVGFIKIDVEGFEPQAIRGASDTIRTDQPELFWEYHFEIAPKIGWTPEDVRDQIEALAHYEYCVVHEDDPVCEFPPTRDMGVSVNVWCRRPGAVHG